MKTPVYETSAGALAALLAGVPGTPRQFAYADLYTITCVGGLVLRYVNSDVDWGYSGTTWVHNLTRVDSAQNKALAHWKIGLPLDKWIVYLYPRTVDALTGAAYPDRIGDIPFAEAARGGLLDNALFTVDRAYIAGRPDPLPAVIAPVGAYRIFTGTVGIVDVGYGVCVLNVDSLTKLLTTDMPRNLFQYECAHTLFGAGCNNAGSLPPESFVSSAAVFLSTVDPPTIVAPGLAGAPPGSHTYALGKIQMTSGPNNGFWRPILTWDGGSKTMRLGANFPFALTPGDTFLAYPGCDKTRAMCNLFGNILNYGGEPFIPPPELSV